MQKHRGSVRSRGWAGLAAGWVLTMVLSAAPVFSAEGAGPPHENLVRPDAKQQAAIYLSRKQYDRAIEIYSGLLETEDPWVFRDWVKAYSGQGRPEQAEPRLRQYLTAHPASSAALYGLGFLNYLMKNDSRAEEYLERAVQADPGNALAWNNWGAVLAGKGEAMPAVEKVERAIGLSPGQSLFYRNLLAIYRQMGRPERFEEDYRRYLGQGRVRRAAGYGKALAGAWRQEGFRLYSQGKPGQAIKKFQRVVQVYRETGHTPGLVAALFALGLLYEETGEEEKAREYYREVLKINPRHLQAREKMKPGTGK